MLQHCPKQQMCIQNASPQYVRVEEGKNGDAY